jgi:hypothetical protein
MAQVGFSRGRPRFGACLRGALEAAPHHDEEEHQQMAQPQEWDDRGALP